MEKGGVAGDAPATQRSGEFAEKLMGVKKPPLLLYSFD